MLHASAEVNMLLLPPVRTSKRKCMISKHTLIMGLAFYGEKESSFFNCKCEDGRLPDPRLIVFRIRELKIPMKGPNVKCLCQSIKQEFCQHWLKFIMNCGQGNNFENAIEYLLKKISCNNGPEQLLLVNLIKNQLERLRTVV